MSARTSKSDFFIKKLSPILPKINWGLGPGTPRFLQYAWFTFKKYRAPVTSNINKRTIVVIVFSMPFVSDYNEV